MVIDKPGIYKIDMDEYHADPCIVPSLSRSFIKDLIYRSPLHAWVAHPRLNPDFKPEDDKKFDLGSAAHSLLLEGDAKIEVIHADDWRTKDVKVQRDLAKKEGKIPLLINQYQSAVKMVKVANQQIAKCKELDIKGVLAAFGESELSYFWQEDDIWLKVRPDWISYDKNIILDYKTTSGSANPDDLARVIISNGYDIQAALYTRGVKAIDGTDAKFIFIFQEIEEPYLCSFIGLPPEFMEMGKSKVDYGIFLWKECMSTNQWSGYPNRVCWIDRPEWAFAAWDRRAQGITGIEGGA